MYNPIAEESYRRATADRTSSKLASQAIEIKEFISQAQTLSEKLAKTIRERDRTAHLLSVKTEELAASKMETIEANSSAEIITQALVVANHDVALAVEAAACANKATANAEIATSIANAETVALSKLLDEANETLSSSGHAVVSKAPDFDDSSCELSVLTSELAGSHALVVKRLAERIVEGREVEQHIELLSEFHSVLLRRSNELHEANSKLVHLMGRRENYVAALTHDLKNPLIGCNQLLQAMLEDQIPFEEQPKYLRLLLDSTKSMLRMIWNLLVTYRDEYGSLNPSPDWIDLGKLLMACANEFAFRCSSKDIKMTVEVAENLGSLQSDEILLRRVLINLLDNAVKFTPSNAKIEITAIDQLTSVRIAIIDAGKGISENNVSHIFEQFWQCDSTRTAGTGLGLSTAKQIMHVLGGQIECKSQVGIGTEFHLTLPKRRNAEVS